MTRAHVDPNEEEAARAFERALLEAARNDDLPPAAVENAWQRFSVASGALSLGPWGLASAGRAWHRERHVPARGRARRGYAKTCPLPTMVHLAGRMTNGFSGSPHGSPSFSQW